MANTVRKGHPLWRFDRQQLRTSQRPAIIGVDEAGRGALAGPVVAAVALISTDTYENAAFKRQSKAINDSKQLKAAQRDEQFALIADWMEQGWVRVCPGIGSVAEIEQLNILGATRLAMGRALEALQTELQTFDEEHGELLDGAAGRQRLPQVLVDGKPLKPFRWRHEAVVGGDGKSLAIAMASIFAKVTRDRMIVDLHHEDSRYGFDQHKGYGAPRHLAALREHGPSPHHRSLFLRKLELPKTSATQTELF